MTPLGLAGGDQEMIRVVLLGELAPMSETALDSKKSVHYILYYDCLN